MKPQVGKRGAAQVQRNLDAALIHKPQALTQLLREPIVHTSSHVRHPLCHLRCMDPSGALWLAGSEQLPTLTLQEPNPTRRHVPSPDACGAGAATRGAGLWGFRLAFLDLHAMVFASTFNATTGNGSS